MSPWVFSGKVVSFAASRRCRTLQMSRFLTKQTASDSNRLLSQMKLPFLLNSPSRSFRTLRIRSSLLLWLGCAFLSLSPQLSSCLVSSITLAWLMSLKEVRKTASGDREYGQEDEYPDLRSGRGARLPQRYRSRGIRPGNMHSIHCKGYLKKTLLSWLHLVARITSDLHLLLG